MAVLSRHAQRLRSLRGPSYYGITGNHRQLTSIGQRSQRMRKWLERRAGKEVTWEASNVPRQAIPSRARSSIDYATRAEVSREDTGCEQPARGSVRG